MTNWPLIGPAPFTSMFNDQVNTSTSIGYLLLSKTSDGGNWVEYSSSWPETTNRLTISLDDESSNRAGGFEIGIGGAGNERSIIDISATDYANRDAGRTVIPITIRKGERVSINCVNVAAGFIELMLTGYFDPLFRTDLRYSDLMGRVDRNTPTVPDPGATLNTKGAWSEIKDVTDNDYKALFLIFGQGDTTDTAVVEHLFDIGVGAASSEVVLISDIYARRNGRSAEPHHKHHLITGHLNSGVRLAVRSQANNNTTGERNFLGVTILGLY